MLSLLTETRHFLSESLRRVYNDPQAEKPRLVAEEGSDYTSQLPRDLLTLIMTWVPASEVPKLACVCRHWSRSSPASILWQPILQRRFPNTNLSQVHTHNLDRDAELLHRRWSREPPKSTAQVKTLLQCVAGLPVLDLSVFADTSDFLKLEAMRDLKKRKTEGPKALALGSAWSANRTSVLSVISLRDSLEFLDGSQARISLNAADAILTQCLKLRRCALLTWSELTPEQLVLLREKHQRVDLEIVATNSH